MTNTHSLALALAALASATPAAAQYGGRAEQSTIRAQTGSDVKKQEAQTTTAATSTTGRKLTISKQAQQAIVDLQNAVNANDTAAIPAKLAAAQAVAKSPDEKFAVATNQTRAALAANDLAAIRAGIEAMQASGAADNADLVARWSNLGKRAHDAKQAELAAAALDRALALDANHVPSLKLLALTRQGQGRNADTVALMQRVFAATKAAGGKPPENEYMFTLGLAHANKLPAAYAIGRDWARDYPSAKSWHDSLRIYRDIAAPKGEALIDNMRLAHATGGIASESEYHSFASELIARGRLAEAKAVLDAGARAGTISLQKDAFKQLTDDLTKIPARAAIDASAKTALGGATAKAAMDAGDAYYGIGAYAEAAPLYRAALGKSGADANLANLRLGMALARAGDKAGATAALSALTGPQTETAKYWLTWLATQA